jgi:hypothetical protein
MGRDNKVRYLDWDSDVFGQHERVYTHLHTPETRRRRKMGNDALVFSVLDKDSKVVGQVEGGAIGDPFARVDLAKLQKHLNNPINPDTGQRGKTRNTLIGGVPAPTSIGGEARELTVRPGRVAIPHGPSERSVLLARTEPGIVRPTSQSLRRRLGEQFEGIVVPPQPSRSGVFGRAVRFGNFGMEVIDPFEDD